MNTEIEWHQTTNRDTGSLKTGTVRVEVGDTIEIRGEGKLRRVTYVMGSPGNWHATFKGQGAVPEGQLEWRLVSRVGATPEPPAPPAPSPTVTTAPSQTPAITTHKPESTAAPIQPLPVADPPAPPPPVPAPLPQKSEGRLHTVKLVFEIVAIAVTVVGGIAALIWRAKQ